MEYPTDEQVAEAMVKSRRLKETPVQMEERIEGMVRWSDEDLAAIGVTPSPPPAEPAKPTRRERAKNAPSAPTLPDPIAFTPVVRAPRHDGWTADRQRTFIAALAETGCVSEACAEVGITPRSAYRLREHPAAAAFRTAWGHAASMATARLSSIAFERAIHGSVERIYRNGELVEERRKPSDRLLMWLLSHHDPSAYGFLARPQKDAPDASFYALQHARRELPAHLSNLADIDPADCPGEAIAADDLDLDVGSVRDS